MPSLVPEWKSFQQTVVRLDEVISSSSSLSPGHRKIIAELVLVRLAIGIENALSRAAYKIAAGATFVDGTVANLSAPQATVTRAELFLKTDGGVLAHPKGIRWLDGGEVARVLLLAVDASDASTTIGARHGGTLSRTRKIRNHIAHRNRTSSTAFQSVVRQVYGAKLNSVTPGTLLLTPKAGSVPLVRQLLIRSRVMMKEFVRAT